MKVLKICIFLCVLVKSTFAQVSSQLTSITELPNENLGIIAYLQTIKIGTEAKLEEYQALRSALKESKPEASALITGIPPKYVKVKMLSDQMISFLQSDLVRHSWFRSYKKKENKWMEGKEPEPLKKLKLELTAAYKAWMESDDIQIPQKNISGVAKVSTKRLEITSLVDATGTIAELIPAVWEVVKEVQEISAKKIEGTVDQLEGCRIGAIKKAEEKKDEK
jgi:hypothetical protein